MTLGGARTLTLSETPPSSVYQAGRAVDEDLMQDTAERLAVQRNSPEGKEGIAAFFEKRKPSWAV